MLAASPVPFHQSGTKNDGFSVSLVSAEGVSFSVDRARLVASSAEFRNLLIGAPSTLHVPEPASVLAPFLDVLMGAADVFPVVNARASILGVPKEVMRLLVKYECTAALTYASTGLKCMIMEHDVCPLEVFILGAAIGDVTLCRTAIVYSDRDDITNVDADVANIIQDHWASVPAVYKKALMRAWEVRDPRDRGNRFAEAVYLEENKDKMDAKAEISHVERATYAPARPAPVPPVKVSAPFPQLHYSLQAKRYQANRFEVDDDPFLSDDDE